MHSSANIPKIIKTINDKFPKNIVVGGFLMDFKGIFDFLKGKWFNVLIMLGIFLILWRPTTKIINPVQETNTAPSKSWFKDIVINTDMDTSPQAIETGKLPNTEFISEDSTQAIVGDVKKIPQTPKKSLDKDTLDSNKVLVAEECLRRQPELGGLHWSLFTDNKYPTIKYVLTTLEKKYGYENLYSDVDRAVTLVMKSIGDE